MLIFILSQLFEMHEAVTVKRILENNPLEDNRSRFAFIQRVFFQKPGFTHLHERSFNSQTHFQQLRYTRQSQTSSVTYNYSVGSNHDAKS